MGQKITDYTLATAIDSNSFFDISQYISPGVYESQKVPISLMNSVFKGTNLGSANLTADAAIRSYTLFGDTESEQLVFKNNSGFNILNINGDGDVYSKGIENIAGNTFYGYNSGRNATVGNNTGIGDTALANLTTGHDNVAIGYNAMSVADDASNVTKNFNSVFIGVNSKPLADGTSNEIAIGANAVGNGTNTATIGNASTLNNYFFGDLNVTGLAGVGDRNLIVDSTGLIKVGSGLDILYHAANVGAFPGTGDTELIYVADDTDFAYLWDADSSSYKKIGGENLFTSNGTLTDNLRTLNLKLDTDASSLDFRNLSGNSIFKIDGLRDIYLDNLKATTGKVYTIQIDEDGKLSSYEFVADGNGIYSGSGTLGGDRIIDINTNDLSFINGTEFTIQSTNLNIDATTILSNDKVIKALNGGGQLDLREGADNVFSLTNDNATYGKAWYRGDDSNTWLGFGDNVDLLMDSTKATLRGDDIIISNNDTGSPFFTVKGATSHDYKLLFTKTASAISTVITFQDKSYTVAGLDDIATALGDYLPLDGSDPMTGNLQMGGYQIQGSQFKASGGLYYFINDSNMAAILDSSGLTANRNIAIQDKDYTVAGLDDIKNITIALITTPSSHTGNTTETVLQTVLIPANTLQAGDSIQLIWTTKKETLFGAYQDNVYINTSADLSGSPLNISSYNTNNRTHKQVNDYFIPDNATIESTFDRLIGSNTSPYGSGGNNETLSALQGAVDWTVNQYLVFTTTLTNSSETATLRFLQLTRNRE